MASRKFGPGGVPRLSADDLATEIERLSAETSRTEQWMGNRARDRMVELEGKDRSLRHAFEAGYRMASDTSFLAPVAGMVIALLFAGIVIAFRALF